MTEETPQPEEKKLTPEELKKRRDEISKHYKDQISVLTLQLDYENLLANIEQARAKRLEMIIRQAQMQAPPEAEPQEEPEEDGPKKERVLKKT